jgi:hypothetical protein
MSGGWTVVDAITNKSMPIQGTNTSNANTPYFSPSPGNQDAVGKMRMSTPQALIDTDFEYGTQPTKWESVSLQNNRQSVYYIPQQPLPVTSIVGSGAVDGRLTFTTSSDATTNPLAIDDPIFIQNSNSTSANGWGYVVSVAGAQGAWTAVVQAGGGQAPGIASVSFNVIPASDQNNSAITSVYKGYYFSGCGISLGASPAVTNSSYFITVTTTYPHGLNSGSLIYMKGLTGGTPAPNGAWQVYDVLTPTSFRYAVPVAQAPTIAIVNATGQANLFARPAGYTEPRTFDGGVAFTAGGGVPNQQLIRQTRRYFRYQSGKSIQFSTGTSLKPALFVTSMTSSGTTITVTTRFAHNLTTASRVQILNADQGQYNGIYNVASVSSPTVFTYTVVSAPAVSPATGNYRVSPFSWYGASNRVGMFDQQNGFFFEYDGQNLYAVLRNSINQINGTVVVTNGNATVTGTGTQFASQLAPGDFIVIRGQTYRVISIASNTSLTIGPEYRGSTIASPASCVISKTIETRIPQSSWTDPCDGKGASGYNLDLTRMQMWFIDYSWYGAGVVRYGIRTTGGVISYVTQIVNNNRQFEAYMRSGNMAAHYESNSDGPFSVATATIPNLSIFSSLNGATTADATTIAVTDTFGDMLAAGYVSVDNEVILYTGRTGSSGSYNITGCTRGALGTTATSHASGTSIKAVILGDFANFPTAGTVKVSNTSAVEYIAYTGNSKGGLYGLTRTQAGGGSATTFTFSATSPISVELVSPDTTPSLSHWGSSVIMDGQFNDDKSLIFNFGNPIQMTTTTSITQVTPILAIRIAPSVSNGQTGLLGAQEIINRMQLQLFELGIYATGPLLVNLVLNGYPDTAFSIANWRTPTTQGGGAYTSSLAQVATNTTNTVKMIGGESVAAAFTNSNGQTTLDLSGVRDLGNSILGGGTATTVPTSYAQTYPDGPDILYVCVTPLTATAITLSARLSWKEAKA